MATYRITGVGEVGGKVQITYSNGRTTEVPKALATITLREIDDSSEWHRDRAITTEALEELRRVVG